MASLAEGVGGKGNVSCAAAAELASSRLSFSVNCPEVVNFWVMDESILQLLFLCTCAAVLREADGSGVWNGWIKPRSW
ncbi:hypothetical protein D3C72_2187210 [compost metagenome]